MQRPTSNTIPVQQNAGQWKILIVVLNDLTVGQEPFDILFADLSLEHSASGMHAIFDSVVGEVPLNVFSEDCHNVALDAPLARGGGFLRNDAHALPSI